MIGSFISDDYQIFFANRDIDKIQRKGVLEGRFALRSNESPGQLLNFKFILALQNKRSHRKESNIAIYFKRKQVHFYITQRDLWNWFLRIREEGEPEPGWRVGSANVYFKREGEKDWEMFRDLIDRYLNEAG
jgi:hypothetical protein